MKNGRKVLGFVLFIIAAAFMLHIVSYRDVKHERPEDTIILAPSEPEQLAESAEEAEEVNELKVAVTHSAWKATELALRQMGLEGKVSLRAATYEVCRQNGIAVPEWGLKGKHDSRNLPEGFELHVSVQDMYAFAEMGSPESGSGASTLLTTPVLTGSLPLTV